MSDWDLNEQLRAFKESMSDTAAPDRLESKLLAAFRERRGQARTGRRLVLWPVAAAAVLAAAGFVALLVSSRKAELPKPVAAASVKEVGSVPAAQTAAKPAVKLRRTAPAPKKEEVATDFIPLVTQAAWGPGDSVQIVRVRMPRADLVAFGLPLNPERAFEPVKADIVLGQDGVARAVRLVR